MIQALRRQILAGDYPPGAQLPNQVELASRLGVSVVTAQLALKQLEQEGFLEARHRQGRFVSLTPPHLSRYGLAFANAPTPIANMPTWSRYYQALGQESQRRQQAQGQQFQSFYGLGVAADSPTVRELERLVCDDRLAGLIFANVPPVLYGSPILTVPGFPRLALDSYRAAGVVPVVHDRGDWARKAVARFAAAGRRRVALISFRAFLGAEFGLLQEFATAGIDIPPFMRQSLDPFEPEAVKTYVQLLLRLPPAERPDGLLIGDDNLVDGAMAGLVASGTRVPEALTVVAYANFPNVPATPLPVHFIGFDVQATFGRCVECIDRWRRGERPPVAVNISASENGAP